MISCACTRMGARDVPVSWCTYYAMNMTFESPSSVVYFIRLGAAGAIKIGKANDLKARLASLQTAASDKLHVLGFIPGDLAEEAALHRRFAASRLHGEWFRPSRNLLEYISEASIGTEQTGPTVSTPRSTPDAETMQRLISAKDRRRAAEAELRAAVQAARDKGGSIRVIADAAGLSTRTVQDWLKGTE